MGPWAKVPAAAMASTSRALALGLMRMIVGSSKVSGEVLRWANERRRIYETEKDNLRQVARRISTITGNSWNVGGAKRGKDVLVSTGGTTRVGAATTEGLAGGRGGESGRAGAGTATGMRSSLAKTHRRQVPRALMWIPWLQYESATDVAASKRPIEALGSTNSDVVEKGSGGSASINCPLKEWTKGDDPPRQTRREAAPTTSGVVMTD